MIVSNIVVGQKEGIAEFILSAEHDARWLSQHRFVKEA